MRFDVLESPGFHTSGHEPTDASPKPAPPPEWGFVGRNSIAVAYCPQWRSFSLCAEGIRSGSSLGQPGIAGADVGFVCRGAESRIHDAPGLPWQDRGIDPGGGFVGADGRLSVAFCERQGCARFLGSAQGWPKSAGLHLDGRQREPGFLGAAARAVCQLVRGAQSRPSGLLSGLLVTLLQPRVTRHRE